jgi:Uma2 family endonuclease
MSYAEFLRWCDEDTVAEWVDGEVIVPMPATRLHQTLVRFLLVLVRTFAAFHRLGEVFDTPFQVRLWPEGPVRQPDLVFVAAAHGGRVTPTGVEGPPDLVVEVVSDDSMQRDRVDKFDEYEKAGVREYWILDNRPDRRRAWFYRLDEQGRFVPILPDADGVVRSSVLSGFWLREAWLWEETPDEWAALVEVIGPERMLAAIRERFPVESKQS